MADPRKILTKARVQLLLNYPFFGYLAMRLRLIETKNVPTTAVDFKGRLFYNPEWVSKFTTVDAICEVAHEVMHLVEETQARFPIGGSHQIWNRASDDVIDTILIDSGLEMSDISKKTVTPEVQEKVRTKDKTVEKRYQSLLQEIKDESKCEACKKELEKLMQGISEQDKKDEEFQQSKQNGDNGEQESDSGGSDGQKEHNDASESGNGSGHNANEDSQGCSGHGNSDGSGGGGNQPGNGTGSGDGLEHTCGNIRQCCSGSSSKMEGEAKSYQKYKWKQEIVNAADFHATVKSKGSLSGMLSDFIVELVEPSVRWTDKIRYLATSVFKGNFTYKKHNRRGHAMKVRLPGRLPENKGLVCMVDTSGSMSKGEVTQCISEIVGIMDQCNCAYVYVIFHDVQVYHADIYTKDTITNLNIKQGGTSHQEAFSIIRGEHETFKLDEPPGMIVAFTDLYSDIESVDNCGIPTIWAYTQEYGDEWVPPWGEKVKVEGLQSEEGW